MNGTESAHAGIVQSLKSADPQFQIGVNGVLYQHGNVHSTQGVGQFLHGEGVDHCARSDPQQVDAVLQRCLHVGGRGYLGRREHTELFFYVGQPRESDFAHPFETAGLGARFPNAGTEYFDAVLE